MAYKSQVTKEIQEKNKSKKDKDMKNLKNNSTVKTILTVFITLVAVAALAGMFVLGMNYQKSISSEVNSQVKDVVSTIKVEPLK